MAETILALNAGSSTLKYALYDVGNGPERELAAGTVKTQGATPAALLDRALREVSAHGVNEPSVIGHRVVHGGPAFTAPVKIDAAVLVGLQELIPLAPLHLPPTLEVIQQSLHRCASAVHVACFDTAFHRTLPDVARRFALSDELYDAGVKRYGFHGLSYEYVLSVLGAPPPRRLIVAHLGSGASVCAIAAGKSIDTSMGLTPTGGIPMGTRSGDLDPGLLLYLMRQRGLDPERLEQMLNHEAGLLGVGGSADMVELLARARGHDRRAINAIELFAYAVKKQIGAYVAVLGGVDCLVFTGGIGEHSPLVRELACTGLAELGIDIDPVLNAGDSPVISRATSACEVRVVATNEDLVIARAAYQLSRGLEA
jgi:acetate kinase